jgi:hypothetical protein
MCVTKIAPLMIQAASRHARTWNEGTAKTMPMKPYDKPATIVATGHDNLRGSFIVCPVS